MILWWEETLAVWFIFYYHIALVSQKTCSKLCPSSLWVCCHQWDSTSGAVSHEAQQDVNAWDGVWEENEGGRGWFKGDELRAMESGVHRRCSLLWYAPAPPLHPQLMPSALSGMPALAPLLSPPHLPCGLLTHSHFEAAKTWSTEEIKQHIFVLVLSTKSHGLNVFPKAAGWGKAWSTGGFGS